MGAPHNDLAELVDKKDRLAMRPQRCAYCQRTADVSVQDDRGRTHFACEDHLTRAVDGLLVTPRVFALDTHEQIPLEVKWHVTSDAGERLIIHGAATQFGQSNEQHEV